MSPEANDETVRYDAELADSIGSLCEDFASNWTKEQRAGILELLEQVPAHAQEFFFLRLVQVDFRLRVEHGLAPTIEDYDRLFPSMSDLLKRLSVRQGDVGSTKDDRRLEFDATVPTGVGQAGAAGTRIISPDSVDQFTVHSTPEIDRVEFGEYRDLVKIAQGGMGVVYRARQARLNRTVAIKMVRSGEFGAPEAIARFYAEAESAAKLNHPNIVSVYEVGQVDGQHFYSMEYIEGESLAARIQREPLANRSAAETCMVIAEAMDFAHQQGVLHRDLKPANIMLDESHGPRITDFGLAKVMSKESDLTRTGQVMGTPSYMPPEQALGQLDQLGAQADVYSIGAILYCCLTGRPPFQSPNSLATMRQLLHEDPVAPRKLNTEIDADLETICLKCLEKSPARRYPTAAALADDLRRYINGHPIQARPIGATGRVIKWTRRNPMLSTAACVAVISSIALIAITLIFNFQLSKKNSELQASIKEESKQKARAQAQAQHASEQSILAMETLGAVIEDIQLDLSGVAAAQPVRQQMLDEALERLGQISQSLRSAPEANEYIAEAHLQLATLAMTTGVNGQSTRVVAEEEAMLAYDIAKKLFENHENSDVPNSKLARAAEIMGEVCYERGDVRDSETWYLEALEANDNIKNRRLKRGEYNVGILRQRLGLVRKRMGNYDQAARDFEMGLANQQQAFREFPQDPWVENALAFAHARVGSTELDNGSFSEAEKHFLASLEVAKNLADEFPLDYRYQHSLATRYEDLGLLARQRNELMRALDAFGSSVAIRRALEESGDQNVTLRHAYAVALTNLAGTLTVNRDFETAESYLEQALKILGELDSLDALDQISRESLADAHHEMGELRFGQGRFNEAFEHYESYLKYQQEFAEAILESVNDRLNHALAHERLSDLHANLGAMDNASAALSRCMEIRKELCQEFPNNRICLRNLLITQHKEIFLLARTGGIEKAEAKANQALEFAEELTGRFPDSAKLASDLAISYEYVGNVAATMGQLSRATTAFERSIEHREELLTEDPDNLSYLRMNSVLLHNLGSVYLDLGDTDKALLCTEKNLQIKKHLAVKLPESTEAQLDLSTAHEGLGLLLSKLGRLDEAMHHFERRHQIVELVLGTDPIFPDIDFQSAIAHCRLGEVELLRGNTEQAERWLETARQKAEVLTTIAKPLLRSQILMAEIHTHLGDLEMAREAFVEAENWYRKALGRRRAIRDAQPTPRNEQLLDSVEAKLAKASEGAGKTKPKEDAPGSGEDN